MAVSQCTVILPESLVRSQSTLGLDTQDESADYEYLLFFRICFA